MKKDVQKRPFFRQSLAVALAAIGFVATAAWADGDLDFGAKVEQLLRAQSEKLFGVEEPLEASALGPYTGDNGAKAIVVAKGLKVSVVSNVTHPQSDMIALWPDDANPTHAFVCIEDFFSGNNPAKASLQRVNLHGDPESNVEVVVRGISSCDPVRRTPWGSIVIGEESGPGGGLYEIMNPMSLTGADPAVVTDREAGAGNKPNVVKRKAVGNVSWEGIVILENGTTYFGDEKRPSNGKAGGGVYKFVPAVPYHSSTGTIVDPDRSPFASGTNFGLRLGTRSGNTDYGQGSETGKGIWIPVDPAMNGKDGQPIRDVHGNVNLGKAQELLGFTGYYRPEDMERDPIAAENGRVRVCWANTGRMTNGVGSAIENGHNTGEVLCLGDPATGPVVTRFAAGDGDANHFDNMAFQPRTGNLVLLEDGEVEVLNPDGSLKELRGNDLWMCLPDGTDRDVMTDGCVRIASLTDTDAEPTGFIFDAGGRTAYLNIQHRATGKGIMLKITGFKIHGRSHR